METLGTSITESAVQNVLAKQALNAKKLQDIKKQIEILEGAHTASMKSVEHDKGYCYYMSERNRVTKKRDVDASSFESKIATLEAKKKAFIEEIDSKIEKVERDKKSFEERMDAESERYELEMARIRTKFEDSTPTSQTYRKAQEALKVAEREEKELVDEFSAAVRANTIAHDKQLQRRQREQDARDREVAINLEAKRQEEIKAIEARRAQERKEEEERAKKRVEEAKLAKSSTTIVRTEFVPPPSKNKKVTPGGQISFPLLPNKRYTIKQLDELQDKYIEEGKDMTAEEELMFSRCWAYAERLESRPQWFANRYNHVDEKKEGDIMSEEDFKKIISA